MALLAQRKGESRQNYITNESAVKAKTDDAKIRSRCIGLGGKQVYERMRLTAIVPPYFIIECRLCERLVSRSNNLTPKFVYWSTKFIKCKCVFRFDFLLRLFFTAESGLGQGRPRRARRACRASRETSRLGSHRAGGTRSRIPGKSSVRTRTGDAQKLLLTSILSAQLEFIPGSSEAEFDQTNKSEGRTTSS
jgi:hypothetical protein